MTKAIERAHRIWGRAVVASGLPSLVDRRLVRSRLRAEPRVRGRHLLLAAPGGGNVGDQAMLESVLENTAGPVARSCPTPPRWSCPRSSGSAWRCWRSRTWSTGPGPTTGPRWPRSAARSRVPPSCPSWVRT